MYARKPVLVCTFALLLPLVGCAALKPSRQEQTAAPSQKIAVLNHGYAMLYAKAQELAKIHNVLRVKVQSKDTANFIDDLSQYGDKLSQQLKSLVKRYPSLSLKDTGLPLVEKKKRNALTRYYLKQMAPIAGRTGKDFDRTILLTQREELNQVRFYASAIASVERDSNRRQLMQRVRDRADGLYKRLRKLLDSHYYKH